MLLTDLKYALRSLAARPGFTLVAVLTLALGIGATTAIFSALYHTLLRPMPFEGGERLMYGWLSGGEMMISPSRDYIAVWKERARSFEFIREYEQGEYTLWDGNEPEVVGGVAIERDLPRLLDQQAVLGRGFTEEEVQPHGRRVVALSEGLWQSRFGGRRDVLGEKLEIGDERYEIVGVMPNRLGALTGNSRQALLWLPLVPDTAKYSSRNVLLKLREGVDTTAASAELRLISAGVNEGRQSGIEWVPQVVSPTVFVDGTTQRGLPILFAAVAAVLLIGCANIAGLLLVRVAARRREVAIRAAIGASRASVLRLLGAECLVLALAGGALGVLLAVWIMDLIRMVRPESLTSVDGVAMSTATLLFASAITLGTAFLFGAVPAVSAVRRNLLQPLLAGGGAGGRATASNRVRSILVAGQIALSLTLLVGSLLLVRTVAHLQDRAVGFRPDGVLALKLDLPEETYPDAVQRKAFYDAVLPALQRIPGVSSVGHGSGVPTQLGMMFGKVSFADRPLSDAERPNMLGYTAVTPDYARALGLELVDGRFVGSAADGGVVISESWAKQLWPGASAVGRQIRLSDQPDAAWDRIVGVARDITTGAAAAGVHPHVYVPATFDWGHGWVVLRTQLDNPLTLVPQVRRTIAGVNARLVPRDFTTMNALLSDNIAMQRFFMMLLGAFAGLALLLSVIGLYGVISNAVAQRSKEIGVRLALGASPAAVRRMVLFQGLRLTGIGVLLGGVAAAAGVRLISASLYGVRPWDPFSFLGAAALLTAAALAATFIPAQRALRLDPLATLRAE